MSKKPLITPLIPQELWGDEELVTKVENSYDKIMEPVTRIIPHEEVSPLSYDNLVQTPEMGWLSECKLTLIKPVKGKSDREVLQSFLKRLHKEASVIDGKVSDSGRPVIALDTETNTLDTTYKLEGGSVETYLELVSLPIAISDTVGFLVPVKHNETDGVRNFNKDDVIWFLQKLIDNFHIVYFNFNYDGAVLSLNGVELDPDNYTDMVLVGDGYGFDTYSDLYNDKGLKNLSNYFLGRKMLEITEIVGSKSYINMGAISATHSMCYAIPDALNTFGLYNRLVVEEESEFNPYISQEFSITLDHKTLYHHISMFNHGLPLNDINLLRENVKTIIHRIKLVEGIYSSIPGSEAFSISNAEHVNRFIATIVLEDILEPMGLKLNLDLFSHKYFSNKIKPYLDAIQDSFGIILKVSNNKSRGDFVKAETLKLGWGSKAKGVPVLEWAAKAIQEEYWRKKLLPESVSRIEDIIKVVDTFRSLQLELTRLGKMYRYAIGDDRGFSVANGQLRFNGTDTRRYSNSPGKGLRRVIFGGKTLNPTSYTTGNGGCGINFQGLPSTPYAPVGIKEGEDIRPPVKVEISNRKIRRILKMYHRVTEKILKVYLITKFNQKK